MPKPQKVFQVMSRSHAAATDPVLHRMDWTRTDIEDKGLPRFNSEDITQIRAELRDGAGFVLVDGCGGDAAGGIDAIGSAFYQFGAALGHLLQQNLKQETLVEIADFSDEDAFDDRGYRSPGELTPHTDPPPMLALHCVTPARTGGCNFLVSAESIRNRFRSECPDLLTVLEKGFMYFLPNEAEQGAGIFRGPIPALIDGPGGLSCVYYRPFIERAAERSGTPLSALETEALNRFDRYATDPDLQISLTLQPGETLVLNNFRVLHARNAYEDWPEKSKRRRLLRLWLNADWMPAPPASHAMRSDPMAAKRS